MPDARAIPARVCNLAQARAQYGDFTDRFLASLMRTDPLADAVAEDFAAIGRDCSRSLLDQALQRGAGSVTDAPASLLALFRQLDHVPVWVDWQAIERAGQLLFRTGIAGGTVLGAKSLLTGYCSPGGNKPLIFSGQLHRRDRIGVRLAETSRFVVDVCSAGGMRRFGPGFAATVRVRIMHAAVRRLLAESGDFRTELWGEPINQHDMVGTTLLFSLAFVQGVRQFGFQVGPDETEDFLHLWRYNGYVMGVEPELLPSSEAQGLRLADTIELTQGDPDADSRALVHALIQSPLHVADPAPRAQATARRQVSVGYGLARALLGDVMADKLDLPRDAYRWVLPAARQWIRLADRIGRRAPGYEGRLVRLGHRYWASTIELGLAGGSAAFSPPSRLDGLSAAPRT